MSKTKKEKKDQLTTYYESLFKKVEKYINEKKLEKALEIIDNELESPYIPQEFIEKFTSFSYYLKAEIKYLKNLKNIEHLNRIQLFDEIFSKKKSINSTALTLFFDRYKDCLELEELKAMDHFLSSQKSETLSKQMLFTTIKSLGIDYSFDYYNEFNKSVSKIHPYTTPVFCDSKYFVELKSLIDELTYKEPSLEQFCSSIAFNIYLYCFPKPPNFEIADLGFAIFQYMIKSLQGGKIQYKDEHIIKYIEKVIASYSDLSKSRKN